MTEPTWQKSSFSGSGRNDCPEAAGGPAGSGVLLMRESGRPEVVLTTTPARLRALLSAVRMHGSFRA